MSTLIRRGRRPRLADVCCCQGGASTGYHRAGFDVTGIDITPQPRYPYPFILADAVAFILACGAGFDLLHVSPPCQAHTNAQRIQGRTHPDLIAPVRHALTTIGVPYVIENVPGAPLHDPVTLCGAMFGLRTYRHRLFETNWHLTTPEHPAHTAPNAKMGRPVADGQFMHIVGNFSNVPLARTVMDMPWASRDGLREAIPPAYTHWIGTQHLSLQRSAAA
ncbi:SAM-dependent methyltransferase [Streptomyces sp. NPDC006649]|uniref:SAM-dependent methyltransferase n=1 Tax=Streptomyces sp. NPDC006649 TaxID=3156896 RepID=UPI0033ADCF47